VTPGTIVTAGVGVAGELPQAASRTARPAHTGRRADLNMDAGWAKKQFDRV